VAEALGLALIEIGDWNCCGATAVHNIDETVAVSLSARILALAARVASDLVAPCSACYTNLLKANKKLAEDPRLRRDVSRALAEVGLAYDGDVTVRHLLEVVVDDVGLPAIEALVERPLTGLRVAPYYGCQIVRPLGVADHRDRPDKLHRLLEVLGAEVVDYPMMTTCCGASLMATQPSLALRLCRNLLRCAQNAEACAIAVACPLCQLNLDVYQGRVNATFGTDFHIAIPFFTQLMGMAFGIADDNLGLTRGIVAIPTMPRAGTEVG
jgi:heterodisulfide reductase subunit B